MNHHMGVVAVLLPQQILHFGGLVVGFPQGDVTIHQDMHLDGIMIAYPSGA